MHFTSAFISTLLSALTVLANIEPYAGYKTQIEGQPGRIWVRRISAVVKIPGVTVDRATVCQSGKGGLGYIAVALGDPRDPACGGGGITQPESFTVEAGLVLTCFPEGYTVMPYSYSLAHGVKTYQAELNPSRIKFDSGDEIELVLEIEIDSQIAYAHFNNLTKPPRNTLWMEIASVSGVSEACLATAMLVLRAEILEVKLDSQRTIRTKLPKFTSIEFSAIYLWDNRGFNIPYTVPTGGDAQLIMKDPINGDLLAYPVRYSDKVFKIYDHGP